MLDELFRAAPSKHCRTGMRCGLIDWPEQSEIHPQTIGLFNVTSVMARGTEQLAGRHGASFDLMQLLRGEVQSIGLHRSH